MSDDTFFSGTPIEPGTYSNLEAQPLTRETFAAALKSWNDRSRQWPPPPVVHVFSPAVYWSIAKYVARHPRGWDNYDIDEQTMVRAREYWRRHDMRRARMKRKKTHGWA